MVEPLQAIVWRLPNGAGGQAAAFYAHKLNQEVGQWIQTYHADPKLFKWNNVSWYRGQKAYFRILTMPKEYATMFLLSWPGRSPLYIDEYIHPDEH